MNREQISPGWHECALERSGRGGRHVRARGIVWVERVERSPWYTETVRYRVAAYRALLKGIVRVELTPRDVLRSCTEAEVMEYERYFKQAREHGWLDHLTDDRRGAASVRETNL